MNQFGLSVVLVALIALSLSFQKPMGNSAGVSVPAAESSEAETLPEGRMVKTADQISSENI